MPAVAHQYPSEVSTEPTRILQHLVSRGYQQNFAEGKAVSIIDAVTGALIEPRRPTKTNWRVPDFLSVLDTDGEPDDALEKEFADDERVVLNRVRDVRAFKKVTADQKRAVDVLTAIHLVRSLSYKTRHGEVVTNWLSNEAPSLIESPRLLAHFMHSEGREPAPGELEAMVTRQATAMSEDPNQFPNGVRYGAARLGELLSTWHLQLIEIDPSLPGLVLADHPILHGQVDHGALRFEAGAVGNSDTVLVPITRHLGGSYTPKRLPDLKIKTKKSLDWLNSLFIRSALAEVACHPHDALATARLIRNIDRYPPEKFKRATLH